MTLVLFLVLSSWMWTELAEYFASVGVICWAMMTMAARETTNVEKTGTEVALPMVAVCGCALLCIVGVVDFAFWCLRRPNGGGPVR